MTAATFRSRGNGVRTDFQRPGGFAANGTLTVALNGANQTSGFTALVDGTGLPIVRFTIAPANNVVVSITHTADDAINNVPAPVSGATIAALTGRVDDLEDEASTLAGRATALEGDVAALDVRVTALEPTP